MVQCGEEKHFGKEGRESSYRPVTSRLTKQRLSKLDSSLPRSKIPAGSELFFFSWKQAANLVLMVVPKPIYQRH